MGAEQSSEIKEALEGAETEGSNEQGNSTRLYKWVRTPRGQRWEFVAAPIKYNFYDANEDSNESAPAWHLEIDVDDIDAPVESLGLHGDRNAKRVTFSVGDVWCLKFPNSYDYGEFYADYINKLFESTYGMQNTERNRVDVLGKDFAGRLFTTADGDMDWEEEGDTEVGESAPEKKQEHTFEKAGSPISLMKMGIGRNSFLLAGPDVSVLRNMDGKVEESGARFNIDSSQGGQLTPMKMVLAKGETQMNVLSTEKNTSIYNTDIETGKVVAEWDFQKNGVDVPMKDIIEETKAAPSEDRSTFLGLDSNRLCRWDMRDPKGVVQEMSNNPVVEFLSGKDYARGTKFTCMASSGDGSVAVGSEDGKVRLYSNKLTLTRASTAFPSLGLAITALDVSFDGKWVVATTDQFLILMKTTCKDHSTGATIDGFKKSMAASTPHPKLLALKPQDAAVLGNKALHNGRFTFVTEEGRQERWIVASCGNHSILWNFRQAKVSKGDGTSHGGLPTITKYHLVPRSDHVVDSQFMHDNYSADRRKTQSALVVATTNKVWSAGD